MIYKIYLLMECITLIILLLVLCSYFSFFPKVTVEYKFDCT